MKDNGTYMIFKSIQKSKNMTWTAAHLEEISPGYKRSLKKGIIQILNWNLVLYNPILANQRYIALIIVPQSMRRSVFSHFHDGPSGGHMGYYKTLYRMRLRLFCPKSRKYVK